jgi:hypothetical protein
MATAKFQGAPWKPLRLFRLRLCIPLHLSLLAVTRAGSEDQSHREFQLTRRRSGCHPGNDPGARAINATASWISRIDVVEDIEGIKTELGVDVLADRSVLQCGEIGIEERRASVAVALSIAECIEVGPGERSGSRAVGAKSRVGHEVRPRVGCSVEGSEIRWHNADRLVGLAGSVRYVRSALAIARTEGETARPVQGRA